MTQVTKHDWKSRSFMSNCEYVYHFGFAGGRRGKHIAPVRFATALKYFLEFVSILW